MHGAVYRLTFPVAEEGGAGGEWSVIHALWTGRASYDKVYPKGHTVIHAPSGAGRASHDKVYPKGAYRNSCPSGAGVLRTIRYRKFGGLCGKMKSILRRRRPWRALQMKIFMKLAVRTMGWTEKYWKRGRGEYDNAVCLQGFAAECARKAILREGYSRYINADGTWRASVLKKYGHGGTELLGDLEMMLLNDLELASVPGSGQRPAAFRDRTSGGVVFGTSGTKIFSDGVYGSEDAENCRRGAEKVVKEMVSAGIWMVFFEIWEEFLENGDL